MAQVMKVANDSRTQVNAEKPDPKSISPASKELVIGLVGYAGAGCSTVGKSLLRELKNQGYTALPIVKLSSLIADRFPGQVPLVQEGVDEGKAKLDRAKMLQNCGDEIRSKHGGHAVASLAIKKIKELRKGAMAGAEKLAFVLDSIKHVDEVELLRNVYDKSFRLVAVHCERGEREHRLFGEDNQQAKFIGADTPSIESYLDRDEKDSDHNHGQQVRDAFFLADYFLDNNQRSGNAKRLSDDLERLVSLLLGTDLVRPRGHETGMFCAHAAALRSSCLSRQVGAALQADDGTIVATGTNEVPSYGGGVYVDGSKHDHRCFAWEWDHEGQKFTGCHNARLKEKLTARFESVRALRSPLHTPLVR
jgi:deoxycytidylate deaminase